MGSRVDPEFPSPEEEGAGQHTFHGRMPTLTLFMGKVRLKDYKKIKFVRSGVFIVGVEQRESAHNFIKIFKIIDQ